MNADNKVDYSKAFYKKKFQFTPFLPNKPIPLKSAQLNPDEDLLILDRNGERFAFLIRQMTYHHIAQGTLNGQPYLVSF